MFIFLGIIVNKLYNSTNEPRNKENKAIINKSINTFFLFFLVFLLFSCDFSTYNNKYHCVLYDNISCYIKEDFQEKYVTNGSYYKNKMYSDESLPKEYLLLLKTIEEVDDVFEEVPFELNFDNQFLLVYCFTSVYNFGCKLNEVKIMDGICEIDILEKVGPRYSGTASRPHTNIIAITIDIVENVDYSVILKGNVYSV